MIFQAIVQIGMFVVMFITSELGEYRAKVSLNKTLLESLAVPRVHHQWKLNLLFHDKLLLKAQLQGLSDKGHKLKQLRF